MSESVLSCSGLCKRYVQGDHVTDIFSDVDFSVAPGERISIVGVSGVGKSTFLQVLGGLDKPTSGQVFMRDQSVYGLSEAARTALRNQSLGFIYQFHHLLPEFNSIENVMMPLLIRGDSRRSARKVAHEMLESVALADHERSPVTELSGGERQRVAFARALVTRPDCVLADEPTGNLDAKTAKSVLDVMMTVNREYNISFVVVTHSSKLAQRMCTSYRLTHAGLLRVDGAMEELDSE